jgi:hypothetical protein
LPRNVQDVPEIEANAGSIRPDGLNHSHSIVRAHITPLILHHKKYFHAKNTVKPAGEKLRF